MKKCKCSFETQTRAANPHIPSSDKNQRVNIRDLCDRGKIRIREKALRNESLDRSNAKDLVQVVRILREVDVSPVSPNSTTKQKDRRQEKPHSVRFFCFIKFQIIRTANDFPQSLLDFLEPRAMKRKSINPCAM